MLVALRIASLNSCGIRAQNAFSAKLQCSGFNMYSMFVGDELHEWSLGTWRSTFAHLIRILHAADIQLTHKLDSR